jgi:GNAT superfamily N-acetyltransferase
MGISIHQAETEADIIKTRDLFRAYAAHLAANPSGAANICIEGFEQEIATLPGPYAAPDGLILLAHVGHTPAGCVALRPAQPKSPVAQQERSCEMKRLWVGEAFRGHKLGRQLVQSAIAWAKSANCQAICLDTAPAAMPQAQALYQSLGFEQIPRYNDNPVPGILFFRLNLK